LRSEDYRVILDRIATFGLQRSFRRAEVAEGLNDGQRRKLDNFLQKMKHLNVIRSGVVQGEYVFNVRMVGVYLWLTAARKGVPTGGAGA
jgi:hypothetical protein